MQSKHFRSVQGVLNRTYKTVRAKMSKLICHLGVY